MKMKKILTEWRKFVITEAIEKSNFEKIIEDAWARDGRPYNEELAYVKAALHASTYMNGSGTTNEKEYLNRVEFGKTATERIQELNRNGSLFAEYFDADEVYHPAEDKRFKDTRENKFKGVGITQSWAKHNMNPSRITGVFAQGNDEAEAYRNLFSKFEQLDQMLSSGDYDFLSAFGRQTGRTNMDVRHSGGAASTGLLITPSEATDAEQEQMMEDYLFYMQNSTNPNVDIAIEAESKLQSAINIALNLWKKYGGFKDSADEQVNKGAYLRMKKALSRSKKTVKKLLKSPDLYEPETPTEEPQDEYQIAMTTKDKAEAARILKNLQRAGDKRWRDIRTRMRSM
jgi:hypothetical protein